MSGRGSREGREEEVGGREGGRNGCRQSKDFSIFFKVAGTKSGTKISPVELCKKALPKSFYVACSLLVSISTHNRIYTSE